MNHRFTGSREECEESFKKIDSRWTNFLDEEDHGIFQNCMNLCESFLSRGPAKHILE